tara:strand:- start:73 stop:408 length:336 start_codon:yes stop_codon:yes gene_type:complete
MKINPFWTICLLVRISLIFAIRYNNTVNKTLNVILSSILLLIGFGFMYKGYTGSNNEVQLSKVFWHETRYLHGILYILAGIYLFNNNLHMNTLMLTLDTILSILYRIITNQ